MSNRIQIEKNHIMNGEQDKQALCSCAGNDGMYPFCLSMAQVCSEAIESILASCNLSASSHIFAEGAEWLSGRVCPCCKQEREI